MGKKCEHKSFDKVHCLFYGGQIIASGNDVRYWLVDLFFSINRQVVYNATLDYTLSVIKRTRKQINWIFAILQVFAYFLIESNLRCRGEGALLN